MPVYLGETEQQTETKCPSCGGKLTVTVDSAGHCIIPPCQRCLAAKRRTYGNVKT